MTTPLPWKVSFPLATITTIDGETRPNSAGAGSSFSVCSGPFSPRADGFSARPPAAAVATAAKASREATSLTGTWRLTASSCPAEPAWSTSPAIASRSGTRISRRRPIPRALRGRLHRVRFAGPCPTAKTTRPVDDLGCGILPANLASAPRLTGSGLRDLSFGRRPHRGLRFHCSWLDPPVMSRNRILVVGLFGGLLGVLGCGDGGGGAGGTGGNAV